MVDTRQGLQLRGFQQQKGIDYEEVFSPVVNIGSLCLFFALSTQNDYVLKKFDIKIAFLYGTLHDEIYMSIPEGYEIIENKICHLKKALYGLKQAPLRWNEHFTNFLKQIGLTPLNIEQCIFRNEKRNIFLAVYVDDGLVIGEDEGEVDNLLMELEKKFEITFNRVEIFLGIKITKGPDWMKLDQKSYVQTILKNFNMKDAKTAATPMIDHQNNENQERPKRSFPY